MAADAQVQYAFTVNVLAELLAISDTVIFLLFSSSDGMRRRTPRHQCMLLLDELSSVSWNRNMFLESIANTFKERRRKSLISI